MKPNWLDRELIRGPHLTLVLSEKEFKAAEKSMNLSSDEHWIGASHARTHYYENGDKELLCIVALDATASVKWTGVQVAAILVHEAVHVWQYHRDDHGFKDKETEAYAIQMISTTLMQEYIRRTVKGAK